MKPAQIPAVAAPPLTYAPSITYQAPAPALVCSDGIGAEHLGCTRAALAEHLSWMARHPRWRERVIEPSRKRRLAAPSDVIESMRERYAARPADAPSPAAANDAGELTVDDALAELGHVRRAAGGKRGGR